MNAAIGKGRDDLVGQRRLRLVRLAVLVDAAHMLQSRQQVDRHAVEPRLCLGGPGGTRQDLVGKVELLRHKGATYYHCSG